jgi:hypothetical protein
MPVSSTGALNILSASVMFYNGLLAPNVTVQLENVTTIAVVTVSASGFTHGQFTITVVPSGVEIQSLGNSIGAGVAEDINWHAQVGIPSASNTANQTMQRVRGGSPGFVVTLSNSNGAVAQLRSDEPAATGQTVTKPIRPGTYCAQALLGGTSYGLAFDSLAAGSTNVKVPGPPGCSR